MSYVPPYRYRSPSLRGRPISLSRAELLASIHTLSSSYPKAQSKIEEYVDPEYYFATTKLHRQAKKFQTWLYNPSTKEVMGRTGLRWFQLLVFFLIFYGTIAGLFAACMGVFMYAVIMDDYPHRTGEQSLLKLNPGLGMIPQPDHLTSLIGFKVSQKDHYRKYVDDIVAFSQWYEDYGQSVTQTSDQSAGGTGDAGFATCPRSPEATMKDSRRTCRQELNIGGRCNIFQEFGYDEGMPCIMITLNRIYGWLPDPLDNHTGVLIRCYGMNDVDKEHLGGICYHDDNDREGRNLCANDYGELKSYYYPYLKQINYQSPIVFVEFLRPARHVLIMVECRAYAKNIYYNRATGDGSIRFELLID